MTPTERAEKILKALDDKERLWTYGQNEVDLVAAREKAKRIARELEWKDHGNDKCLDIAQRIAEMEP